MPSKCLAALGAKTQPPGVDNRRPAVTPRRDGLWAPDLPECKRTPRLLFLDSPWAYSAQCAAST
eukprot:1493493-Pyramimonas_sp.AAC.1